MTNRFRVVFSPRARAQYREARNWWQQQNPGTPDRFRDDLRQALDLISEYPSIGRFATNVRRPGIRHVRIGKTPYSLYYKVAQHRIEVRAIWHGSRGTPPVV